MNVDAVPRLKNRFDRHEWAGAFADLGTLIPFVTAYLVMLKMPPQGIFLGFGVALVLCGWFYKTPIPVQPMKAIGAVAATQSAFMSSLSGSAVVAASLATGVFWLLAGLSGLSSWLGRIVPKTVLTGVMLGLGLAFMHEGGRMMASTWWLAIVGVALLVLLHRSRVLPAMFALLLLGAGYAFLTQPGLLMALREASHSVEWTSPLLTGSIGPEQWILGIFYLALPQIPLTLGNAILGIEAENNRQFPGRPVTARRVSVSTGLMNLLSGSMGGVPMCHGAGGMAAHVAFGARTGGSSMILGSFLIISGLLFSAPLMTLLLAFPTAVLGVILFAAGLFLVKGNLPDSSSKTAMWVVLLTAGLAAWNVAVGFLAGWLLHFALARGWAEVE